MIAGKNNEGLLGVRYWIQVYPTRIPRFEVFEYEGEDAHKLHWFRSRDHKTAIRKSMDSVATDAEAGTFKPFLLDMRRMTARIGEEIG